MEGKPPWCPFEIYRMLYCMRQVWAKSVDPDQTAPLEEQSDQGLHFVAVSSTSFGHITLL